MSSNSRLYQALGLSPRELFGLPTRYLRGATARESEFEKPYLTEDYPLMQALPPWPGVLDGPRPGKGDVPDGEGGGFLLFKAGCRLSCTKMGMTECEEYYRCSAIKYWSWRWISPNGQPFPEDVLASVRAEVEAAKLGAGESWKVYGLYGGLEPAMSGKVLYIHPPEGGWTGAALEVLLSIYGGAFCTDTVDLSECEEEDDCCIDPEYTFDWDEDNSPETIAEEESKSIYVLGGCSPFSWSVVGTGFSLQVAETEGRTNVLIAGATSCGAAEITVTDACSEVVVGYIRSTEGQWVVEDEVRCTNYGSYPLLPPAVIIGQYGYGLRGYQTYLTSIARGPCTNLATAFHDCQEWAEANWEAAELLAPNTICGYAVDSTSCRYMRYAGVDCEGTGSYWWTLFGGVRKWKWMCL